MGYVKAEKRIGERHGSRVITGVGKRDLHGNRRFKYLCDCGEKGECHSNQLLHKATSACPACSAARAKEAIRSSSLHNGASVDHPGEFQVWKNQRERMCRAWKDDFHVWYKEIGSSWPGNRSSLRRKDPNRPHLPDNSYWGPTAKRLVLLGGKWLSCTEAAAVEGVSKEMIRLRANAGHYQEFIET